MPKPITSTRSCVEGALLEGFSQITLIILPGIIDAMNNDAAILQGKRDHRLATMRDGAKALTKIVASHRALRKVDKRPTDLLNSSR
jgi:hypothetical protein